jgi:hypothetical protein
MFRTDYIGTDPSRNRVVEPARQAAEAAVIDSFDSVPGLLKTLKYRLYCPACL